MKSLEALETIVEYLMPTEEPIEELEEAYSVVIQDLQALSKIREVVDGIIFTNGIMQKHAIKIGLSSYGINDKIYEMLVGIQQILEGVK